MGQLFKTPTLTDLYDLREQIDQDNAESLASLRERDHTIGTECEAKNEIGRLLFWLKSTKGSRGNSAEKDGQSFFHGSAITVARLTALVMGVIGMAGFLFARADDTVNVQIFLIVFVFLQVVLCGFSLWVLLRLLVGSYAVALPLNPARFLVYKMFPDKRFYSECKSVIQLMVLRYGQELGALFAIGAVVALYAVGESTLIEFYWGSTNTERGPTQLKALTDALSWPWSSLTQSGQISIDAIELSMQKAGAGRIVSSNEAINENWWAFLKLSMIFYVLIPRALLWIFSRVLYRRSIRRSFLNSPGAEGILSRMTLPLLSTQARDEDGAESGGAKSRSTSYDKRVILVDWAGAIGSGDIGVWEEFQEIYPENVYSLGVGSLAEDLEFFEVVAKQQPDRLFVVVKSWEPPMADLHDFISEIPAGPHFTIFLLPLRSRPVSIASVSDWEMFCRGLDVVRADLMTLKADIKENIEGNS